MGVFRKVFGRVQFYNKLSEYYESLDQLMEILYQQNQNKGLPEFIVVYGSTPEGKLYRSVFDFNSFSLQDLVADDVQFNYRKFQKYLGELLLESRVINAQQLEAALREQEKSDFNERLGEVLIRLKFAKSEDIVHALEAQVGVKG